MGQKYLLDGARFTNHEFKKLYDDAALNDGSLVLLNLGHSLSTPEGLPANNSQVYNIAWRQAQELAASGDQSAWSPTFLNTFTAPYGAFERTAKGGLHGVVSRTDQGGQSASLIIPAALKAYFKANPYRHYAIFIWANVTRIAASTTNMRDFVVYANTGSTASNSLLNGSLNNTAGAQRIGLEAPSGMSGAPNSNDGLNNGWLFAWGNVAAYNSLNSNDGKGVVLYQLHLVDVAASGKTYAELSAADQALYDAAFSEGGKFYGDSLAIDPATLP